MIKYLICLIVFQFSTIYPQWTKTNLERPIRFLKTVDDLIFASSSEDGIHVSTDGINWSNINGDLPTTFITSIAGKSDSLYVGTVFYGVFLSTNNGQNWKSCNNGFYEFSTTFCSLIKDNVIYLGSVDGVYRSINNGMNWEKFNEGLYTCFPITSFSADKDNIYLLNNCGVFKRANDDSEWVDTGLYGDKFLITDNIILIVYGPTINISSDNGNSWFQPNSRVTYYSINALAEENGNLFAAASDGVFLSTDNGLNWKNITNESGLNISPECFAFDNDSILVGGLNGIFKSTDLGITWKNLGNLNKSVTSIAVRSGILFAGTMNDGVLISTDGGSTWNKSENSLPNFGVTTIFYNDNTVFAGLRYGVYGSTDNGLTWQPYNNGISVYPSIDHLIKDGSTLFASTINGVFYSSDNGINWQGSNNNQTLDNYGIYSLVSNNNLLYAGTYGNIFISQDKGSSWESIGNGLPQRFISNITFINGNIFCTAENAGVFKLTDQGNWIQVNKGIENLSITSMTFKDGKIVIGTDKNGIFISYDEGANWLNANVGLSDLNIKSIEVFKNILYAGTDSGAWSCNLDSILTGIENKKFAVSKYELAQNYPNPFNPTTKISYQIPKAGLVSLKVYNILGKEIASLVNEEKPAGSYEVQFDGRNLSSGIYFYKLSVSALRSQDRQAGNYSSVKKMVLIK